MSRSIFRSAVALPVLAVLVGGCSGINTNTDFDPASVSRIQAARTYDWLEAPDSSPREATQIVEGRVVRAVDTNLSQKGYRKSSSTPQLLVGWHVATQDKTDVDSFNSYYGYGYSGWGPTGGVWTTDTYVREYTEGTLVIDVVDAESNQLVWRGTAEGEVDMDATPDERERKIREAVDKVLEDFPPEG